MTDNLFYSHLPYYHLRTLEKGKFCTAKTGISVASSEIMCLTRRQSSSPVIGSTNIGMAWKATTTGQW